MTKPETYREQRVIRVETHYQVQEGFPKGPQAGVGVLAPGRVVWVQNQTAETDGRSTTAFADGIGIVSVDPRSL